MERYLTVQEVCKVLNITKMTVYGLIKSGELPSYRIGRAYKISPSDLEKFIKSKKVS